MYIFPVFILKRRCLLSVHVSETELLLRAELGVLVMWDDGKRHVSLVRNPRVLTFHHRAALVEGRPVP